MKNDNVLFRLDLACNDACLESENLKNIIDYMETKKGGEINIYNEDTLKGRRKSQILKYQNSAREIPFALLHKNNGNRSKTIALYTEDMSVTYENVINFFEDKKDSKAIEAFDFNGNLLGMYYPEKDKFVKLK